MLGKGSRKKVNFRDCEAPVDHLIKGGEKEFTSVNDAINKIFNKKPWYEVRDERIAAEKLKSYEKQKT